MISRPPLTFSEEAFVLPTTDGKRIYGILNKSTKPNGKVVVLSHGLTGYAKEHIHVMARNVMTDHGYDVVRFNYYDAPHDARKLENCTIRTHADDLNLVCNHFRSFYNKLFVAGHSYGGLAILHAAPVANGLAFWDSSYVPYESFWKDNAPPLENTAYHICGWGTQNLINPAMIDLDQNMGKGAIAELAQDIATPSLVVLAGDSQENPVRTALFDGFRCQKKLIDIAGADHVFTNGHTVYDLLDATLEWFDAH